MNFIARRTCRFSHHQHTHTNTQKKRESERDRERGARQLICDEAQVIQAVPVLAMLLANLWAIDNVY